MPYSTVVSVDTTKVDPRDYFTFPDIVANITKSLAESYEAWLTDQELKYSDVQRDCNAIVQAGHEGVQGLRRARGTFEFRKVYTDHLKLLQEVLSGKQGAAKSTYPEDFWSEATRFFSTHQSGKAHIERRLNWLEAMFTSVYRDAGDTLEVVSGMENSKRLGTEGSNDLQSDKEAIVSVAERGGVVQRDAGMTPLQKVDAMTGLKSELKLLVDKVEALHEKLRWP